MVLRLASPKPPGSRSARPNATASASLVSFVAETSEDVAVTTACAVKGAYGGALAGEMLGGDLALQHLGPIAEPFGQGVGRNIGRILGGAAGAAVIRCPSRSSRSTSRVRFSPEIRAQMERPVIYQQVAPISTAIQQQHGEIQVAARNSANQSMDTSSEERLVATMRTDTAANAQCIVGNMAKMFGMARTESRDGAQVLRDEIQRRSPI